MAGSDPASLNMELCTHDRFARIHAAESLDSGRRANGGQFANINKPTAGATHDKELPVGKHPFQLYSLATPNGVKVTVMLEELLAAGHMRAPSTTPG